MTLENLRARSSLDVPESTRPIGARCDDARRLRIEGHLRNLSLVPAEDVDACSRHRIVQPRCAVRTRGNEFGARRIEGDVEDFVGVPALFNDARAGADVPEAARAVNRARKYKRATVVELR